VQKTTIFVILYSMLSIKPNWKKVLSSIFQNVGIADLFKKHSHPAINIYTDGSSYKGTMGSACILIFPGDADYLSSSKVVEFKEDYPKNRSSEIAEFYALYHAMKLLDKIPEAQKPLRINLRTDYDGIIDFF